MRKKRLLLSVLFLVALTYFLINIRQTLSYQKPEVLATHYNGEQFVGSLTCMECHSDIYKTHLLTAHHNTSALANTENIGGSFEPGSNKVDLDDVELIMKVENDTFYQFTKFKNSNKQMSPEQFDIVIGSGVRGKSYLSWEFDYLFQLQASYHSPSNSWINSPSFPNHRFVRPVSDGCLKCHLTFAKNREFSGQTNQFDKSQLLYGIECERCHRPAQKHVTFHRKNPDAKVAKHMISLAQLPRQKRLDVCAQCHSGLREKQLKGNPFSFLAGENLNEYSENRFKGQLNMMPDVHGNQYGLLTTSKCFKASELDCSTCHDPHKNERGNLLLFNQKCMNCHQSNSFFCTVESTKMTHADNNCITCHMPNLPSKSMSFQLSKEGQEAPARMRTHLIGIYPEKLWHETTDH